MKTLFLKGGLGNQLFQLAFCFNNLERISCINTYYLDKYISLRNLETQEIIKAIGLNVIHKEQPRIFLLSNLASKIFNEDIHLFAFNSYFQKSFKKSEDFREIAKNILLGNTFKKKDKFILHIRGTDFINVFKDYEEMALGYYKKVIHHFRIKEIDVATDDQVFANRILRKIGVNYSIGNYDFRDIASYNYIISMNSTFSWWAGYLGDSNIVNPTSNMNFRKWPKLKKELKL